MSSAERARNTGRLAVQRGSDYGDGLSVRGDCPSWCTTNHLGIDRPVEHDGPQWPNVPDVTGTGRAEIGVGTHGAHGVVVALYAESLLAPKQARKVAMALLEAASWAEDNRLFIVKQGRDTN